MFVEAGEVLEAHLVSESKHFSFGLVQFLQADFVNLIGREVSCGHSSDRVSIARVSIRKFPDARLSAAVGRVVIADELAKFAIRGNDLISDRGENCITQAFLLRLRNARGKLFQRFGEGTAFAYLFRNIVDL